MNILYLSYASEPGKGSEYGVGWNVPLAYANKYTHDEVCVLTRSRVKEKIKSELNRLQLPNLHYLFYDIPKIITYPNEMKSNWGEQINYLSWQLLSRKKVSRIVKQYNIDLIHHLTFNQYRTPSPGFWMKVPFVMGPIGGAETIPSCFEEDLTPHTLRKERIRRKGKDLSLFAWFTKRSNNKKIILYSSHQNEARIMPHCSRLCHGIVMPAIAFSKEDFNISSSSDNKSKEPVFEMIYAGKAWDWKGLHIFLKAVKKAFLDRGITDVKVRIIGIRFKEEQDTVKEWVESLNISGLVEMIPFIERSKLLSKMQSCDLSVYPAFRDSGSMSVLEASALGCPTLCFNVGGQDAFPDNTLFKIEVKDNYKDTLNALADKLLWIYNNREEAAKVGNRAKQFVEDNLTWEKRVESFHDIYIKTIDSRGGYQSKSNCKIVSITSCINCKKYA